MASRIRGEKLNMLTNPLNMYHRPNRIQKGEVNDPNRTSFELQMNTKLSLWLAGGLAGVRSADA
jgi:hypothetical protein